MSPEIVQPPPAASDPPAAVRAAVSLHPSAWGALLASSGVGLALKELGTGRYVYANEVLLGWMGLGAHAVIGNTDGDLFEATAGAALRAADEAAVVRGEPMSAEHRITWAGQARDFAVWRAVDGGNDPPWRGLLSLWTDLADRKQREAQLRGALMQIEQLQSANEALRREIADQALRDPVSGLYARAHFDDHLRREVDLSSREHREFSIVFIELDTSAPAGDALDVASRGPPARVLATVQAALGRLLRGGTRAMDAACRLDERRFAVLFSGVGLATAHSRMEGLRRRCEAEIVVFEGRELRFTVAMGVASFPHTSHTQAELLQACTSALQEAQRRGGNHVALAAISLDAPSR